GGAGPAAAPHGRPRPAVRTSARGTGKGPGLPFGPDPSRRRRARNPLSTGYPGPSRVQPPDPAGVPRLDGTPALRLAVLTECPSVMDAESDDVRRRPTGQSRAGLAANYR